MSEPKFNRGSSYTDQTSEDEPQASSIAIGVFKKQYDVMTPEQKARLPNWLREYLDKM